MSDKHEIEIDSAEAFREAVEAGRAVSGMSLRGVAALSDVGHASYWAWLKSDGADVTLKNALAYAKSVGLKLVLRRA